MVVLGWVLGGFLQQVWEAMGILGGKWGSLLGEVGGYGVMGRYRGL